MARDRFVKRFVEGCGGGTTVYFHGFLADADIDLLCQAVKDSFVLDIAETYEYLTIHGIPGVVAVIFDNGNCIAFHDFR